MEKPARYDPDVHEVGQQVESHDTDGILEQGHGEHGQGQQGFVPELPQEDVSGQDGGDEEGQARAYPTAFLGDFDEKARQIEHGPILQERHSEGHEQQAGHVGRADDENSDSLLYHQGRNGHGKKQEGEREESPPAAVFPVKQEIGAAPEEKRPEGRQRGPDVELSAEEPAGNIQPDARGHGGDPPWVGRCRPSEHLPPAPEDQVSADERDQGDVTVVLGRSRVPQQVDERRQGQRQRRGCQYSEQPILLLHERLRYILMKIFLR